ncbi:MAG: hypothetical protein J6X45_06645 [Lachnospiraceae bacterium]|nr:hypothetical protein [Lachnospiraceae bacterium]
MRLCKYCNKPIAQKDIWNPDNDGNGYHHQCLVDMEFKARDKQIYDKGKTDVLDKIKAETMQLDLYYDNDYFSGNKDPMYKCNEVLQIIDKYTDRKEQII